MMRRMRPENWLRKHAATETNRADGRSARWGLATPRLALWRPAGWSVLLLAARLTAADPVMPPTATAPATDEGHAALQQLRTFATTGRVLHVGAHPDDENTELIAYLSRGRGYDTAYLSITRGDGGQNILGPQLDEKLGVARTQELLAARRIDGGRQFFTRAIDFGFSKTPEETLSIWNHQAVLSDVVRVIRQFRPDVIVTRFPIPPGSGGHDHHTASAILAVEAFKLAGDPTAFPEQLKQGLTPWQPKRVVWNRSNFSRGGGIENGAAVKVDVSGKDPVTGESFVALAGRSRAMHKTQGFGDFAARGAATGPRSETFVLLGGDPAEKDLMDGVDTTWGRVPGGEEIGRLAAAAIEAFKPEHPSDNVPALLALRQKLNALKPDPIVDDKRAQLDRVLRHCLQLEVASTSPSLTIVPGETLPISATVKIGATVPVKLIAIEFPGHRTEVGAVVSPTNSLVRQIEYSIPKTAAVTQPYWLRQPSQVGLYTVEDPNLIGRPESPPDLPLSYTFELDGQTFTLTDRVVVAENKPDAQVNALPVAIVPRVALRFDPGAAIFRPGATTVVAVEVVAGRPKATGTVTLGVPPGWRASAAKPFSIEREMQSIRLAFEVTAPAEPATGTLQVVAQTGDEKWTNDAFTIHYPHIPTQLLQPPARKKVVSVMVGTQGHSVGYVPGAGDDVAAAIKQLGYQVTELNLTDLTAEKLAGYDAVVIGVRAFNTRPELAAKLPALFEYVENGGRIVCQYNWARNLKVEAFAPYRIKLSESRVTDETAPVTFIAPEHPILNQPNKISPVDFEGWVQERGVYFPSEWDERFVPVLQMNDPGEPPLKGALLVAPHGKGQFVYTSLALFRQLPAGVPGAYRLFANMLSFGK